MERPTMTVLFDPRNIWRTSLVLVAVLIIGLAVRFVVTDGGSVIFTVLLSWFASLAMEPAVRRLTIRMPRGVATIVVMLSVVAFLVLFSLAFGRLFIDQIASIVKALPDLLTSALAFVNQRFGTDFDVQRILTSLNISPSQVATYAADVAGGLLGIIGSVVGSVFGVFTFALFTFYLSADAPRLRRWIASLFPGSAQRVLVNVWDVTAAKTGSYVAARIVLAAINGGSSAVVFLIIGMPYWLALGIWTGLVAQFVPTIGTYISIILPVIVGLLSPNPWVGVIALGWALVYQQVENLTIEPRISAKAVDVHPAVAFGSVLLGAALFGITGALLAVPVCAMLLALLEQYRTRYALLPEFEELLGTAAPAAAADDRAGPETGPREAVGTSVLPPGDLSEATVP